MRINTNMASLNSWRNFSGVNKALERSLERLSSGLRVNRAGDDVAGLAISERMRSNIRGLTQAMKNTQDGISLIRTAEGALQEMNSLLQRGRELAVQAANGVYTPEDRESIQTEVSHLLKEIDRISDSAEFNGRRLFGGSGQQVTELVESLRRSWMAEGANLVATHYNLTADGVPLKIVMDDSGQYDAWVQGTPNGTGRWDNLELHINLQSFASMTSDQADRVIAHEMTHAIMARSMNYSSLPKWFREGTAEFIAGADEKLYASLTSMGAAAVTAEIDTWEGTVADYAGAYGAVKYLHDQVIASGNAAGIRAVMDRLQAGDTFDLAIATATGGAIATAAAFESDYKGANGQAFISGLNLTDADVGAIGGGDHASVVPDSDTNTWDPLADFNEIWPTITTQTVDPVVLQVGDQPNHTLELPELAVNTYALGLIGLDLVNEASASIETISQALSKVTEMRTQLGAIENRLEHTYNVQAIQVENLTAAESKIRDADMAFEMMQFTKQQMILQAGAAMMAQANNLHRKAVQTLLG